MYASHVNNEINFAYMIPAKHTFYFLIKHHENVVFEQQ